MARSRVGTHVVVEADAGVNLDDLLGASEVVEREGALDLGLARLARDGGRADLLGAVRGHAGKSRLVGRRVLELAERAGEGREREELPRRRRPPHLGANLLARQLLARACCTHCVHGLAAASTRPPLRPSTEPSVLPLRLAAPSSPDTSPPPFRPRGDLRAPSYYMKRRHCGWRSSARPPVAAWAWTRRRSAKLPLGGVLSRPWTRPRASAPGSRRSSDGDYLRRAGTGACCHCSASQPCSRRPFLAARLSRSAPPASPSSALGPATVDRC